MFANVGFLARTKVTRLRQRSALRQRGQLKNVLDVQVGLEGGSLSEAFAAPRNVAYVSPVGENRARSGQGRSQRRRARIYLLEFEMSAIEMTRKIARSTEDLMTARPGACTELEAKRTESDKIDPRSRPSRLIDLPRGMIYLEALRRRSTTAVGTNGRHS